MCFLFWKLTRLPPNCSPPHYLLGLITNFVLEVKLQILNTETI